MNKTIIRSATPFLTLLTAILLSLLPLRVHGDGVMINEFMASNQDFLEDEDGNHPDWIELYNSDSAAYDLEGHFLTDDPDNLDKWMFPAVSIPSGGHLLVFASEKDRSDARGELHTNFRLDGDGDQLLLITPDGSTILSGFFPSFPPQVEDTSYGVSTNSTFIELVGSDAPNRVLVPTDDSLESTWMNRTFNDNSWRGGRGGVGFERGTGYDEFISTDVEADMYQQNGGVYIRIPFEVEDRDTVNQLRLQMRYDDGFTSYLNGSPILSVNSPSAKNLAWNSNASLSHIDTRAREYENFNLGEHRELLRDGSNVLAIHGLNRSTTSNDFLIDLLLLATSVGDVEATSFQYFGEPTPGEMNGPGFDEASADVEFSIESGAHVAASISVELSAPEAGTIRYTLDGSKPQGNDPAYSSAIRISNATVVTARLFAAGKLPGRSLNKSYIMLSTQLRNVTSNLPIVLIDTFSNSVGQNNYTNAFVEMIETTNDRAAITDAPDFSGRGALKIRGSSSTGFPKKQYALEIRDELNEDRDVPLLGMPAESDWVLYAPYSDKSLMRNYLSYDWSNQIGRYGPRCRFVELYFKTSGGRMGSSHYAGVYVLIEKIKRNPDRVDIARLSRTDNSSPEITGGYILKKDRLDPGDNGIRTNRGQTLGLVEPKEDEITSSQRSYILNYINQFESALYGNNFTDPERGYRQYIDAGSFIDHHIMVELCKNIDGYRLSAFYHKDRNGKLHMGPVWDFNLALGNANYLNGGIPQGWYYPLINADQYPYFPRLFQDPEFEQQYIDRWAMLRRGPFQTQALLSQIDEVAVYLDDAQRRNFQRWNILGTYVWPNYFVADTYPEELDFMKGWLEARLSWYDSNYVATPVFNQEGGGFDAPFDLRIGSMAGTVYYTTDGSDPRLTGGAINPRAEINGAGTASALVSPDENSGVRAIVPTDGGLGRSWTEPGFDDSAWLFGGNGVGVGYERGEGYQGFIDVDVESQMYNRNSSVYIRVPFEVNDPSDITQLTLRMMYDDGFIAYLNGQRVAASNSRSLVSWNSAATAQHDDAASVQFEAFSIPDAGIEALRQGTNVLAIQGFNFTIDSSDLLIVPILSASSTTEGEPIVLTEPVQIKARAKVGNEWSGLAEATFVYNSDLPLRITELMYHPARPRNAGAFTADDFEFVEIQNVGTEPAALAGVYFDNGIDFDFTTSPIQALSPGEFLVVVENLAAFSTVYETDGLNIAGQYGGNLDNGGERISLTDGRGEKILEFRYEDDWLAESDGGGHSLNIIDPSAGTESWNDGASWALSAEAGGTPGAPGGGEFVPSGWQLPGDANQDGILDISDPVRLLRQLYLGAPAEVPCDSKNLFTGGSLVLLDVNGDSRADLSDAVYTLNFLFIRGPEPVLGTECIRVETCPSICR